MANSVLSKSVNFRTLLMGVSTVIYGTAASTVVGNEEILPAILCLLFAIFFQTSFNLRHRYHDFIYGYGESATDELEQNNDSNIPTRMVLKEGSIASAIVAGTIGLGILSFAGWWTLIMGALLALLAWINYLGSHQLTRTPLGLLVTFLIFGPVGVTGTSLVQITSAFNNGSVLIHRLDSYEMLPTLYFGLIAGFMAVNCHLAFSASTVENDALNGKRTFTVKYGHKGSEILYIFSGSLMLITYIVMQVMGELPHRWYVMIAPVLCAMFYFIVWRKVHGYMGFPGYSMLQKYSIYSMFLLAVWTLIFYLVFGTPDKATYLYFG